ncbi:hypothetical protein AAC387_Pa11g2091 [Persea americana]
MYSRCWFSFSTMLFARKENTVSSLGRVVLLIWLFVLLIIQSSYTASLTSILTVQRLSSPITGLDSLIQSNVPIGFQVGSFAENYLSEELGIAESRLISLGKREDQLSRRDRSLQKAGGDLHSNGILPWLLICRLPSWNLQIVVISGGSETSGWQELVAVLIALSLNRINFI